MKYQAAVGHQSPAPLVCGTRDGFEAESESRASRNQARTLADLPDKGLHFYSSPSYTLPSMDLRIFPKLELRSLTKEQIYTHILLLLLVYFPPIPAKLHAPRWSSSNSPWLCYVQSLVSRFQTTTMSHYFSDFSGLFSNSTTAGQTGLENKLE